MILFAKADAPTHITACGDRKIDDLATANHADDDADDDTENSDDNSDDNGDDNGDSANHSDGGILSQ